MTTVKFQRLTLPKWDIPNHFPIPPSDLFLRRYKALEKARIEAEFDALLIYADREHSANMAWLTGFDPRFEEAVWIQGPSERPTLIAGNECVPFARAQLQFDANVRLYQEFSLPGQSRSENVDLPSTLREAGLKRGMSCGLIGWKPMEHIDVPYWIVEAIVEVTNNVPSNAGDLLMAPGKGLRVRVEPEMVPLLEFAGSRTSDAIKTWALNLREGITELEAATNLQNCGLELSCHTMTNFGPSIPSGLKSPRNARAERGHYAQAALGIVGSLTSRAGRLMASDDRDSDGYLDLVRNYLLTVRAWYQEIRVGASAGAAVAAADAVRSDAWSFALNPGHLLHRDEWVGSPFVEQSETRLVSGYAIQQDIIPVPRRGNAAINMEDGFVLADHELRTWLDREHPGMMRRMRERRDFMRSLGYEVSDDVLPTSNIPGVFFPFLFEPNVVARFA